MRPESSATAGFRRTASGTVVIRRGMTCTSRASPRGIHSSPSTSSPSSSGAGRGRAATCTTLGAPVAAAALRCCCWLRCGDPAGPAPPPAAAPCGGAGVAVAPAVVVDGGLLVPVRSGVPLPTAAPPKPLLWPLCGAADGAVAAGSPSTCSRLDAGSSHFCRSHCRTPTSAAGCAAAAGAPTTLVGVTPPPPPVPPFGEGEGRSGIAQECTPAVAASAGGGGGVAFRPAGASTRLARTLR